MPQDVLKNRCKDSNFYRFVTAYKRHGHKIANVNPVALTKNIRYINITYYVYILLFYLHSSHRPELELSRYNLSESDEVIFKGIINHEKENGTVGEALKLLSDSYCKSIGAEFVHLEVRYLQPIYLIYYISVYG